MNKTKMAIIAGIVLCVIVGCIAAAYLTNLICKAAADTGGSLLNL